MKISLDRTFRIVWLVVGGLLLVFLLVAGVLVAAQWIGNAGAADDAVRVAREARPAREEPRAVRYGTPRPVRGTRTRIVLVGYGEAYESTATEFGIYGSGREASWVNVVFMDDEAARLLLDRPAYIRDVSYPDSRNGVRTDTLQTWITYQMALEDGDGNGRLDRRDPVGLYVSDVEGRALRPVLRPPLRYVGHEVLDGERMLVYALDPAGRETDERRMRQRAFVYDVASGRLAPHAALDSAAARAAQVVGR